MSIAGEKGPAVAEKKGYKKITLKKGDKINFPKRGDTVSVRYIPIIIRSRFLLIT